MDPKDIKTLMPDIAYYCILFVNLDTKTHTYAHVNTHTMLHKYIQIIIAAEADYCDLVNTLNSIKQGQV